jgi:hypothetical protein
LVMSYLDRLNQSILLTQHEYQFRHTLECHQGAFRVKLEDGTFLFLSPRWEGYRGGVRIYHSKDSTGYDRRVVDGYIYDLDGNISVDTELFFDIVSPFLKHGITHIPE